MPKRDKASNKRPRGRPPKDVIEPIPDTFEEVLRAVVMPNDVRNLERRRRESREESEPEGNE